MTTAPTIRDIARETASRYTFEQFAAIRRYQPTLALSPDGEQVAYSTNISGQFNLWRQPATGGYPRQLTLFHRESVRNVAWSPDGETLVFLADQDGDEFKQLYRLSVNGGRPEPLTDAPRVRHEVGGDLFSPDGERLAYCGNDREPTAQDVIIRDLAGSEVGRPVQADGLFFPGYWSPDGAGLTVIQAHSNTKSEVSYVDLRTGERRDLTPSTEEVTYTPGPWAPDGSGFYLVTNKDREFNGLAWYDLAGESWEWLVTPEWDVEELATAAGGRYLAYVVNENGYSRLHIHKLAESGKPDGANLRAAVTLPDVPQGVIGALVGAMDAPVFAFTLTSAQAPTEVYVLNAAEGTLTKLTESALGGIDPDDLLAPELIHYPTHDDREIPAFLYRPKGDGPFPVVLSIHGGPEAQERPTYGYAGLYQYLLSQGIGVLAPNIRGSTGYGQSYQKLIHRDWGGAELGDLKAAAEYLRGLDWVDGDRLGVFGGSFGGFATLSCVSRLPEYWAAAVDIVGPSNLVTFSKAVPPTWRRIMKLWVGDPEEDADFLMERSPITYVDQIRTPLFVIQGANDPRVVQGESDQIVERLRERGVTVRYDVYDDEGHGFTKRENELKALGDTATFFVEKLARR